MIRKSLLSISILLALLMMFSSVSLAFTTVKSIALNKTSVTLAVGNSISLTPTISPKSASNKVTWSSSDSKIAKVSSKGVVTAVKVGKATITVKSADGKVTAKCTVTVKAVVVKGPVPLTIALWKHPDDNLDLNSDYFKYLQKKTNTKLNIIPMPNENLNEKRNVLLASGQVFDLISVDSALGNLYGTEGIFSELDDLINQYAPNIKAKGLTDKKKSYEVRSVNGKLYQIPRYYEASIYNMNSIVYREDILKELGLKEPETMDEWFNVFEQVKQKHPNMIPLVQHYFYDVSRPIVGSNWDMGTIRDSFGVLGSNMNKIVFLPTTDNFKKFVMYFNKMYKEKLLDQEYVTTDGTIWGEKLANGTAFATFTNSYRADWATDEAKKVGNNNVKFVIAKTPIGITGKRQYFQGTNPWLDGMAVYARSKYKKEAVQFLDFLYTKEGSESYYLGVEGKTYKMVNGKAVFNFPSDKWFENRVKIGYANNIPRLDTLYTIFGDIDENSQTARALKVDQYVVPVPWLTLPKEDQTQYNSLFPPIDTYTRTVFDQLIIGKESFANWDKIKAEYDKLNVGKLVESLQKAYDGYLNTK